VRIKVEKTIPYFRYSTSSLTAWGKIEHLLFITSPQSNTISLATQHEATPISTLRQMVWNLCGHNPKTLKNVEGEL
jgi:hypothetical protein